MSTTLPISEVLKRGTDSRSEDEDDGQPKRSRQENYKKAKELEEARKAGDAPAAVDEAGRDINPHIPQYISRVPFFYNTDQPTLRHQRTLKSNQKVVPLDVKVERGLKIKTANTYRRGACENCGAITHKKKDCLERPRKIGAKYTNKDISPDEVILPEIDHSFDSKRDRWAGFRPEMYKEIIEEHQKVEEAKRKLKEEKLKQEASNMDEKEMAGSSKQAEPGDVDVDDDDSEDDEDEKYADHADMPGTKVDSKQRITVRNLRIREDTAKYLYNLDPNSAHYDPKTRSMRENPLPDPSKAPVTATFCGENFIRSTGEVDNVNRAQLFAWQASSKGIDVHLQALPTKTVIVQREFEIEKNQYNQKIDEFITHKYGAPEKEARPASELQLDQNETYVEYSRTGKILAGPSGSNQSSSRSTGHEAEQGDLQ